MERKGGDFARKKEKEERELNERRQTDRQTDRHSGEGERKRDGERQWNGFISINFWGRRRGSR